MGEYNPKLIRDKAGMKEINFIFGDSENPIVSYGCYRGGSAVFVNLYQAAKYYPNMKTGFIHVPFLPEQIAHREDKERLAAMTLEDMVTAVQAVLDVLVKLQY